MTISGCCLLDAIFKPITMMTGNNVCMQFLATLLIIVSSIRCNVEGQSTVSTSDSEIVVQQLQINVINEQLRDITNLLMQTEKKIDYLQDIARDISHIEQDVATLKQTIENRGYIQPRDCYDVMAGGANSSGIYTIFIGPTNNTLLPLSVYCDMETDGGGWTVFQRRKDGSEDFFRTWDEYAEGFGYLLGEFWIGNNNLFALTRNKRYKLRVDLADFNGSSRYAEYSEFRVASGYDKFKLVSLGTFSGNAGDSFTYHVGMKFSTRDQDNSSKCSAVYKGAWWYNDCHFSNLNGYYYGGPQTTYADGVNWSSWLGQYYSLRFTEMKVRPNY